MALDAVRRRLANRGPNRPITVKHVADTFDDGCPGVAFYFLVALFLALLFIVALLWYLPVEPALESTLKQLALFLPREVLDLTREQMDQLIAGAGGGVLTFGIAGAIWSSSSAMTAIITALTAPTTLRSGGPGGSSVCSPSRSRWSSRSLR